MRLLIEKLALLLLITAAACGPDSANNRTNNGTAGSNNATNNGTTGPTNNDTTATNNASNNDVATCETTTCDANATCESQNGAPTCVCNAGFEGDGTTCADVDECAALTDDCADIASCQNTDGAFTCTCPTGYDDVNGDGTDCVPVDECAKELDNCDPVAICTDIEGSFSCACPAGYADTNGDGTLCADIDECTDGTDNCSVDATCTNTPGAFECACNAPLVGDGVTCVVGEITGALTLADPGIYADGTYAESCSHYRYPDAPYLYQGSTGNGFYAILPPGKVTPIVVECRQEATSSDAAGGWTFVDPAAAQAFGITVTDLTGSGGCGFTGDSPSGHASGALGCRFDIALGFQYDEVLHGAIPLDDDPITYVGIADGADGPDLAWVNEAWGTPYCAGDFHTGDIQWGNAIDSGASFSAGRELYFLVFGMDPEPCASTFPDGPFQFAPPHASTRFFVGAPDTTLRLEFGMEGTADRGWSWQSGPILVRDTSRIPAP